MPRAKSAYDNGVLADAVFHVIFRHITYERDGSPGIRLKAYRAVGNLVRDVRAVRVDGGVARVRGVQRHAQERNFDNTRRVRAHADLEEEHLFVDVFLKKFFIPRACGVPALVLDERRVAAQIHGHRSAAHGATRYQLGRNAHIALFCDHFAHGTFVVVRLFVTG